MVIKQFYGVTTGFVDSFCQWDCGWYSGLIAGGYDYAVHPVVVGSITKDQANWAFFPLFPLLIKGLNIFIHNALLNAIVFNQILLLLSSYLLFLYIVKEYGKSVALFGVALLLFATENIYFMSTYTESLFLFLSLLVLLLLKSKNFLAAAIVVGLLSATRFIGFLFFIPVLFSYLKTRRANFKIKDLSYCFLLIIICSSGLILYMIYLHFHVNDSLAFYHIQSAWGRNDSSWLSHPLNSLSLIFKSGYPYDRVLFYISLVMFFLAVKHKLWLELQLLLITVLPEIASKSLISYSRFMLINVAVYTVHN
jgi:Gpi18-like mannosyltransferase